MKLPTAINFILIFGTLISGVLALVIICVPILAPFWKSTYVIPPEIKNWGGVIIGFYFGSFISQVANVLRAYQGQQPVAEGE